MFLPKNLPRIDYDHIITFNNLYQLFLLIRAHMAMLFPLGHNIIRFRINNQT